MASYNGAFQIKKQLNSYLDQTRKPDQLVISDDNSTDETLKLCREFKERAPFAVEIYKNSNNVGFTKNFSNALSKCTGDVIFISDQDDIWLPKKIEIVTELFKSNPKKLLVAHDGELVDENLGSLGATKIGQVRSAYGTSATIQTGALTAIRKELLSLALPIPASVVGHDIWIHHLAELLDSRLITLNVLQKIVRHQSNTSRSVVSSVKKINSIDALKHDLKTAPASSYSDRISLNKSSIEVLEQLIGKSEKSLSTAALTGLQNLYRERNALNTRQELVESPLLVQKLICLKMLLSGDYVHFNGMKSFLRDLLRF
ncbi:hypothetical protein TMEC54S_03278 [Thauera mechernichensis]